MKLKQLVMPAFTILMIVLLAIYLRNHWESIRVVRIMHPQYIAVLAGLILAKMTLRGYFHWQVMRSLKVDIPVDEAIALNFAGTMMNQLLPMPVGPGYRAAYLKTKYQFPFSLFASTLAALFIYWLMISTGLGLIAVGWLYWHHGIFDFWIFAIQLFVMLVCVSMFTLPRFVLVDSQPKHGFVLTRAKKVVEGWQTIVHSKGLILGASVVVVLSTVVSAASMFAAFKIIGVEIGLGGALLLMASQRIGSLIKLTPGAVGYQEMVGVYFASILPTSSAEAAVVFGLTRIVNSLLSVGTGLPSLWWLSNRKTVTGQANEPASDTRQRTTFDPLSPAERTSTARFPRPADNNSQRTVEPINEGISDE